MASSILADLRVKIGADVQGLEKGLKRTESKMQGFERKMTGIATAIGGVFAIGEAINFGKQIVATTAKMEKMQAVLSNSLGSDSSAELAFKRIQEFASKTPFQIEELTGSFVKLVGQGIRPTMAQMTALGDLAASQGKSFDQLAEGILDATTGEFERLKEFGIRASKQGDKVAFTFKGVTKTVANSSKAIEAYVYSLGDAEGVSGSMADISDTLGGRISNLQDVFTQFQANLGKMNSGVLTTTIDYFIKLGNAANRIMTTDVSDRVVTSEGIKEAEERLRLLQDRLEEIYKNNEKVKNMTFGEAQAAGGDAQFISQDGINKVIEAIKRQKEVLAQLKKEKLEEVEAEKKLAEEEKNRVTTLETLEKQLANLNTQFKQTDINDKARLGNLNLEIEALKERIKLLKATGLIRADVDLPKVDKKGFDFSSMAVTLPDMSSVVKPIDMEAHMKKFKETQAIMEEVGQASINLEGIMSSSFVNIGETIGNAFSNMNADISGLEIFMKGITDVVAGFLGTLGQQLIAAGVASEAFKKIGATGLPAIAAGVALVALSKAVSNAMSSASLGGSSGASISGGGNAKPAATLAGRAPITIEGDFRMQGRELVAVIKNESRTAGRVGGNAVTFDR